MAVENAPARIGKTVVICGEVKGSEDLIVDGRVEGTVTLSESRLTIGPNANVAADLSAKDVLILGQVKATWWPAAAWNCAPAASWKAIFARCGWPWKTMRYSAAKWT